MKKIYTEESVADIADAIREKNGTNNTYKTSEMAAAIEALPSGRNINGAVRMPAVSAATLNLTYQAIDTLYGYEFLPLFDETVPANAFVGLIDMWTAAATTSYVLGLGEALPITDTAISSLSTTSPSNAWTEKLEDGKTFCLFDGDGDSHCLYAAVGVLQTDGTFAMSTLYRLSSASNSANYARAVALSSSKVFVSYRSGTTLYGMIVNIANNAISSVGTGKQISSRDMSWSEPGICKIDSTHVLLAYHQSMNTNLYGVVCTVDNNTFTVGTEATICTSLMGAEIGALSNNRFAIGHIGTDYFPHCVLCSVVGTTITSGADIKATEMETASNWTTFSLTTNGGSAIIMAFSGGSYNSTTELPVYSLLDGGATGTTITFLSEVVDTSSVANGAQGIKVVFSEGGTYSEDYGGETVSSAAFICVAFRQFVDTTLSAVMVTGSIQTYEGVSAGALSLATEFGVYLDTGPSGIVLDSRNYSWVVGKPTKVGDRCIVVPFRSDGGTSPNQVSLKTVMSRHCSRLDFESTALLTSTPAVVAQGDWLLPYYDMGYWNYYDPRTISGLSIDNIGVDMGDGATWVLPYQGSVTEESN